MEHGYSKVAASWWQHTRRCLGVLILLVPMLAQAQTISIGPAPSTTLPLQDFGTIPVGRTSASQSFVVSGSGLTDNVTLTPPDGFQLRTGSNSFSAAALTLTPAAGTLSNTTIDVRFAPVPSPSHTDGTGSYASSLTASTTGGASQSVAVTGTAPAGPYVFVDPTALDFGQVSGSGSGQTKTFTVGGGNLGTTPLTLTAALTGSTTSGAVQVRNTAVAGSPFATSLTIAPVNGQVPTTTVEVRIVGPVASQSNFTGAITATSGGAVAAPANVVQVTANNPFSGSNTSSTFTASTPPTTGYPSGGQPLLPFSTVPQQPSATQTLVVSGSFLVNPITVVAPSNFQIALDATFPGLGNGGAGTTTGNTVSIVPVNGVVSNQTVYVRYVPQVAGTESGTGITFDSSPATSIATIVQANSIGSVESRTIYVKPSPLVIGTNVRSAAQLIRIHAELVSSPLRLSVSGESAGALGNPSGYAQFRLSTDGTTYTDPTSAGTSYIQLTPDATNTIDQDVYVVYAPTRVGAAQAMLQYLTPDVTASPANSLTPVVSMYSATNANKLLGTTIAVAPTRDTPFAASRNTGDSSASIAFNPDNSLTGYGQFHLVLISTSSSLTTPDVLPVNATDYNASNGTFQGTGQSTLQDSKGNVYYVVFAGGAPTATVTNLNSATSYYAYVFDYNSTNPNSTQFISNAENYKSPAQSTVFGALLPGTTPLPVGLTAFAARPLSPAAVRVSWTTANEQDNAGFTVERSADGQAFIPVGTLAGAGSSGSRHDYALLDTQLPAARTLYYRLRQQDLNGPATYSPIRSVTLAASPDTPQLLAYPNPAHDAVQVQVLGTSGDAPLELYDGMGRLVCAQAATTVGTETTLRLPPLPAGLYVLRCGSLSQRLIIK